MGCNFVCSNIAFFYKSVAIHKFIVAWLLKMFWSGDGTLYAHWETKSYSSYK